MEYRALICVLCGARASSLTLWMSHLRQVHESEDVAIFCPVPECNAIYSKVNSLCSHVYRKHRNYMYSTNTSEGIADVQGPADVQNPAFNDVLDLSIPSSIAHDVNHLLHRDVFEQKKNSALFLLQLKEERMITQAAVNDVVSGCRKIYQYTLGHLKAGVEYKLAQAGIDSDIFMDVFHEINDPFKGLETAYLQDKFTCKDLHCIVSEI